jgi:hypothetical protein
LFFFQIFITRFFGLTFSLWNIFPSFLAHHFFDILSNCIQVNLEISPVVVWSFFNQSLTQNWQSYLDFLSYLSYMHLKVKKTFFDEAKTISDEYINSAIHPSNLKKYNRNYLENPIIVFLVYRIAVVEKLH